MSWWSNTEVTSMIKWTTKKNKLRNKIWSVNCMDSSKKTKIGTSSTLVHTFFFFIYFSLELRNLKIFGMKGKVLFTFETCVQALPLEISISIYQNESFKSAMLPNQQNKFKYVLHGVYGVCQCTCTFHWTLNIVPNFEQIQINRNEWKIQKRITWNVCSYISSQCR